MRRFLLLAVVVLSAGLRQPASSAPADGLPPRPVPFRFVTDQGQLLQAAEVRSLENGLRRYADNTGTQVVLVTVPTLGGRDVAAYARALGQSWGVGQRGKDNGLVVLIGAREHQVAIQAGRGLRAAITPELTSRVISEQMTPGFRQGRYFTGLRAGLNTLMKAANPDSAPLKKQPAVPEPAGAAAAGNVAPQAAEAPAAAPAQPPFNPSAPAGADESAPTSAGPGIGTLALGALLVGGVLWLLVRLFRRRAAAAGAGSAPDFLPNQPAGPVGGAPQRPMGQQPGPDFLSNRGGNAGGSGPGMGGILMTGAAAAAGAYLGNRMASGHDTPDTSHLGPDPTTPPHPLDAGAGAGASSGEFPALDTTSPGSEAAPDYFADDASAKDNADYFSSDDSSSYDDSSSDDTGGGGFDDDTNNSGSW